MTKIELSIADLAAILRGGPPDTAPHPLIGEVVVCRCHLSGTWLGMLEAHGGDHVVLRDAIRAWSWKARSGVGAASLATHGLESGKTECSPWVEIGERPIEIHATTSAAVAAWREVAS
jgi:hypothetical protein